jgi:hypothetical protein
MKVVSLVERHYCDSQYVGVTLAVTLMLSGIMLSVVKPSVITQKLQHLFVKRKKAEIYFE